MGINAGPMLLGFQKMADRSDPAAGYSVVSGYTAIVRKEVSDTLFHGASLADFESNWEGKLTSKFGRAADLPARICDGIA